MKGGKNMKKTLKKKFMNTANAVRYFTGETQTITQETMKDVIGTIKCWVCRMG